VEEQGVVHILGDTAERDALVGNLVNGSLTINKRLDSDAIGGLADLIVEELHIADCVRGSARSVANRPDRQTVTTVALSVLESNALHNGSVIIHGLSMFRTYGSRVDGNAIILVVDNSAVNDNVGASTNVKAISVVRHLVCRQAVSALVVDSHLIDLKAITAVDADSLHGCVQQVEVVDS
jgi:hypothetical protein